MAERPLHPWVATNRDRVTVALQAVAGASDTDPGRQLLHAGQLADRYSYDAFFLGDHPAWAPEVWSHLCALAVTTERVRLGQMVAAVPYRTPLLTARLASDLDHLSQGRSILGLGIGWNAADYGLGANEFGRMGLPYPSTRERQDALEEAVAVIRGLWRDEPLQFAGRFYAAAAANVPPPRQRPEPPLVIAGSGPRTLGQVARLADACNFGAGPAGLVDAPPDARAKLDLLDRACAEQNRDPRDVLRTHFTHWLIVAPDRAAVEAKIARYFPRGLDAFWGKFLVAGTPDEIVRHYREFAAAGIQYFVVQTLDPYDEETIALVAEAIAPRLAE